MSRKLPQKEVLDRFKKVHGDKYDYSLVEYLFEATKVKIICKNGHGVFYQTPKDHFSGRGCPDCGKIRRINKSKLTRKQVLDRFKKVHGDTYDYSLVEYVGVDTDVQIICKKDEHPIFTQTPSKHFKGQDCPICGRTKSSISRKIHQKEVLDRFKKVHGDKYDYSLVEYNRSDENVIIICSLHGEFLQTPQIHWIGSGCNECGNLKTAKSLRKTKEKFIEESNLVHGEKYDYSLVEYVSGSTKVNIICKKNGHGVFPMTPGNHHEGQGCPICGRTKSSITRTKSTENFIKQAKEIYLDKIYGYEKVNYLKGNKNVIIVCPIHGDFLKTPKKHLQGQGCQICGDLEGREKSRLTIEEFIERSNIIHNNYYGYDKVEYVNNSTDVIIVCPVHGDFPQTPSSHLSGRGCVDCGIIRRAEEQTKSVEQFIMEANLKHNGIYEYGNVDYKKAIEDVLITCKIHGDFLQTPDSHLQGSGCQRCLNKGEGRLAIILNEIGIVHRYFRISNRIFDFYLPEYDIIIERDGEQHYYKEVKNWGTVKDNHQIDIEKTKLAKSKGHKICRIPYWLSEEDERREIKNILNGEPTYPDVPDLEQEKTKPLPN